jgi:hypothetical protein
VTGTFTNVYLKEYTYEVPGTNNEDLARKPLNSKKEEENGNNIFQTIV